MIFGFKRVFDLTSKTSVRRTQVEIMISFLNFLGVYSEILELCYDADLVLLNNVDTIALLQKMMLIPNLDAE